MAKGHSSNCVYIEGQLQEVISRLTGMTLSNLREGYLDVNPIIQAVIQLETLKKTLPDMVS